MKNLICIIIAIFFAIACSEENQNAPSNKISVDTTKKRLNTSLVIPKDSIIEEEKEERFLTTELLELAKKIDSSGYLYDSIKLRKSYRHFDSVKILTLDGYLFYETKITNTVPFTTLKSVRSRVGRKAKEDMDSLELQEFHVRKAKMVMDVNLLEKVQSIYSYHYVLKKTTTSGPLRTFEDGIIEQWQFESKEVAKMAGEEIGKKAVFAYFNRGAHVCYLNNYVYIFHSRASAFYTTLEKFFDWFVKINKATKAKRGRLR